MRKFYYVIKPKKSVYGLNSNFVYSEGEEERMLEDMLFMIFEGISYEGGKTKGSSFNFENISYEFINAKTR